MTELAHDNIIEVTAISSCSPDLKKPHHSTNQGRGASFQWKHLSFRSPHEVEIAQTLDLLGVMFFPNAAVRLTQGDSRITKEVDFLICRNGRWGVLEVDGRQHLQTTEDDRLRDDAFNDHGVWFIRRYPASLCKSKPDFIAKDFVRRLDAFYRHLLSDPQ